MVAPRPPRLRKPPQCKVRRPGLDTCPCPLAHTPHAASSQKSDTRPNSSHYNNGQVRGGALPPTPPMSSEPSFDGYHSPSTKSVSQMPTQSYYFEAQPSVSPVEQPEPHRHMMSRMPVQPAYAAPAFASSYMSSPAMASYYPTMQPTPPPQPQVSGLYYQRPLPQVSTCRV